MRAPTTHRIARIRLSGERVARYRAAGGDMMSVVTGQP